MLPNKVQLLVTVDVLRKGAGYVAKISRQRIR